MNLTNQTTTQEPISAQTATIISLSLVIVFILLIIFICIYKSCNKRKQRRNKVPELFQYQQELRLLTPEQISRLPPDQQIKIQQYQQSLQRGNRIFGAR